uniref:Uncharacterized protein n=1 Tax=Arundo donax TaxID=35708 RepID=A0A0A9HTA6_ARUDO
MLSVLQMLLFAWKITHPNGSLYEVTLCRLENAVCTLL